MVMKAKAVPNVHLQNTWAVWGINGSATLLKFVCPWISHYASHYHYVSQSIAFSGKKKMLNWLGAASKLRNDLEHAFFIYFKPIG